MDATASLPVRRYQFQLPAPTQLNHVPLAQWRGPRDRCAKAIRATMAAGAQIRQRMPTSCRNALKETRASGRRHECLRGLLQTKRARRMIARPDPSEPTGPRENAEIESINRLDL